VNPADLVKVMGKTGHGTNVSRTRTDMPPDCYIGQQT